MACIVLSGEDLMTDFWRAIPWKAIMSQLSIGQFWKAYLCSFLITMQRTFHREEYVYYAVK